MNEIINQNTKSNMRLKDLMNEISVDVENARTVYPVNINNNLIFILFKFFIG